MANFINGSINDSIYDMTKNGVSVYVFNELSINGIYVILADTMKHFSTSLPIPIEGGGIGGGYDSKTYIYIIIIII